MHNIWVSRTSTTILILKCQIVLAGENRVDDGQFWILRGFLNYWEILGYVKQADWASFRLLFLIIFTLLEFPCCAKSCPGVSLLPDLIFLLEAIGAGLFWHANEEDICCMQMRGPQLRADRFFFPCPRHFCCCLTGFPGDLDQHFHIRVSKLCLPIQPPEGSGREAGQAPLGGVQRQPSQGSCF